ncbi:hypothetical protein H2199_005547 [Coniosporium tulheliwenetii]|uniref:Uncharacterized protein n=1 Tax=Coniosporium tulheliwenetii TaxID=3383036 RepID=A0ACC2Z1Z8_9PEZI|nr:hypothetical protein H2199_005547 [Cladosporium sp. JES 115]
MSESAFTPIPELSRTDADVSILLLNNLVTYTGKVADPWFEATLQISRNVLAEAWVSNSTLTGIGCTEQYQFCNFDRCTPLNGLYSFYPFTAPPDLGLNPMQQATHRVLGPNIGAIRMSNYLSFLKNEILLANTLTYGPIGISTPVPDTQWQTEMENIYNITMAGLQQNVVDHASAPNIQIRPGVELHSFINPETDPLDLHICASEKIRSSAYSSFNMFGLCFLVLTCALIIVVNLSLPNFVHWIQRRSHNGLVPRLAWIEDDVLQLQRIALEGRGIGPWEKKWEGVPVTAELGKTWRRDTGFAEWAQLNQVFKPSAEPEGGGERGELEGMKSQARVEQVS